MAYTGAWRNARTRVDRSTPLGRPELSELHQHTDFNPPGSRVPFAAPRLDYGPDNVMDPGTSYDPVTSRQAPGNPIDHTPEGHDGWSAGGGVVGSRPGPQRADANAAREDDRGAALRQLWRAPKMRAGDERRTTDRLEVTPISTGSRVGVLRGANALPENNPDGFRLGQRVQRFMDRKIPTRWRKHDLRPVTTRLAASAVVSPPMEHGNVYTSPFAWGASARTRTAQQPMERRMPRPWDEDVTTDGATDAAVSVPAFQSWAL